MVTRDEQQLRYMLGEQWCTNQMVIAPYTDDGQFADNSVFPCIDFMNDSVDEIRRKMQTRILDRIKSKKSMGKK